MTTENWLIRTYMVGDIGHDDGVQVDIQPNSE
jgi:hypothetical protein